VVKERTGNCNSNSKNNCNDNSRSPLGMTTKRTGNSNCYDKSNCHDKSDGNSSTAMMAGQRRWCLRMAYQGRWTSLKIPSKAGQ
jgi:hypothetical protein